MPKDGLVKRARFTEEQIIAILKEHEAGAKTADLARKHGVSEATLYNWKAKYGGMDAKRLKQLEDENAKLKKLLAEQMLDAAALRELLQKKSKVKDVDFAIGTFKHYLAMASVSLSFAGFVGNILVKEPRVRS